MAWGRRFRFRTDGWSMRVCDDPALDQPAQAALITGAAPGTAALLIWWQFRTYLLAARTRIATGRVILQTPCAPIEYAEAGSGVPLLAAHGSWGGYDQGMAFAVRLIAPGIRLIAVSRFGYMRSPMPANASADAVAKLFGLSLPHSQRQRALPYEQFVAAERTNQKGRSFTPATLLL